MSEPMKREQVRMEDTWKLADIFESEARWEEAFGEVQGEIEALGEMGDVPGDKRRCLELLDRYFGVQRRISALVAYANMNGDQDTTNHTYQALSDRAQTLVVSLGAATGYIAPGFLALPGAVLDDMAADPDFSDYVVFFEELRRGRAHTLSASSERMLALTGDMAGTAQNVYEMLVSADMVFPVIKGERGEDIRITQSNYVPTLMSRDERVRSDAYAAYYATLMQFKNTISASYSGAIKADQFAARVRKFASTREAALFGDNIPLSVYDNLIDVTRAHLPSLNRFLDINARLIGKERLSMKDVYVPAVDGFDISLPFDEAYELVVESLAPLGADYQAVLRRARDERWIDRYENKGKRSGAYAWGTYDTHPYVLLNYHENLSDLLTIAHEMGHAMHTYYSGRSQPYTTANYSLFAAEVASTVNEVLVLLTLMKKYPQREAQALLLNKLLDAYRTTLFRQTMFAEFEREAHKMAEAGEALTTVSLNALYERLNREYYPSIEQGPEAAYEWMRIPHFYRPFYVYVYATGFSAATALASGIDKDAAATVPGYKEFLSLGGSRYPIDALKVAGVDMTTSEPVERALTLFEELLARYEQVV